MSFSPRMVHISPPALILMLGAAVAIGVAVGRAVQSTPRAPTRSSPDETSPAKVAAIAPNATPVILPGVEIGKPISEAWIGDKRCFGGWCSQYVWGTYAPDVGRACVGPENVVLWWTTSSSLEQSRHTNGTPYGDTATMKATNEAARLTANYKAAGYLVEPQATEDSEIARSLLISPEGGHLILTVTGGPSDRDPAKVILQPEGITPIACRK